MSHEAEKRFDLLVAGRAGIDFNPTKVGCTFDAIPEFTKSVGGSPANIVMGAARLGLRTTFMGKVAQDGMGEYIAKTYERNGIHAEGLVFDHTGARNCLALLEVVSAETSGTYRAKGGEIFHGTYLYRENTADMLLAADEISEELIAASRAVLLTGTAFSREPSRGAMFQILKYARAHNVMTVLDLDYRPFGWTSPEETAKCYREMISYCDLVIGNREEFDVIEYLSMPTNQSNQRSAEMLLSQGVQIVIVKDGKQGSYGYCSGIEPIYRAAIPTKALKTFGSGDAYAGGLMYGLLSGETLAVSIELGTACASLALTAGISCSDSMPTQAAMREHWEKSKKCWEKSV